MNDATLTWGASPSSSVTGYGVVWTFNGVAQPAQTVARTNALDASGYSLDFVTANPTLTVKGGDVIGASVDALDSVNSLASAFVVSTPATVTIPTVPVAPQPPVNVALALALA